MFGIVFSDNLKILISKFLTLLFLQNLHHLASWWVPYGSLICG